MDSLQTYYTYPVYTQAHSPASSSATSDSSYTPSTDYLPHITSDNLSRSTQKFSKSRLQIAHPYARLVAKKDEVKRRKIWNHALEKSIFTPYEISTLGAPHRRVIYMASLESHIDELHAQLLSIGYYPVPFSALEQFKGLNSKTAKSMVAGLQHDVSLSKLKLLELERANADLQTILSQSQN
ncbi:hypothetical protein CC2G_001072 [Coprinopsis cinerea AmutBmut pab1-1]|nr:hypothetical protein CC2G_001072 [Coprinopsis cinerea AmutBmut pab1-1]